jgi:hypothetical protein
MKNFKHPDINIITVTFLFVKQQSLKMQGTWKVFNYPFHFISKPHFKIYISFIQFYHPTLISNTVHYTANLKNISCE